MEMNQIYQITNTVVGEVLGESVVVNEDLSNIVDVGTEIFNAKAFDHYVGTLVNHIGRVIFVDRAYSGSAPSVLMDGWEFGSVMEKIASEMPVASENESWELEDGKSYDPHVFYQPKASAKFFNKRTTFEIDRSITEKQVKESFSNAQQLNGFMSMILNETEKALTVRTDALIMRTINNMTLETAHTANPVRYVNLLSMYNTQFGATLSPAEALTDPGFIRYAAFQISLYSDRLTRMSTLFNEGGMQRFTPKNLQKIVYLSEFARAADVYLQSDVFHDQYTALEKADTVPFWQGSGTDYNLASTGKIMGALASDNGINVTANGVIAVMFDRDALGVANFDRRVTTQWNPKAEFTNYFYKQDAGYFNDLNENFVVFYIAQ